MLKIFLSLWLIIRLHNLILIYAKPRILPNIDIFKLVKNAFYKLSPMLFDTEWPDFFFIKLYLYSIKGPHMLYITGKSLQWQIIIKCAQYKTCNTISVFAISWLLKVDRTTQICPMKLCLCCALITWFIYSFRLLGI